MKPQLQKYNCLPYWAAIITRVKYDGLRCRYCDMRATVIKMLTSYWRVVLPVMYVALNPRSDSVLSLRMRTKIRLLDDTTRPGVELPHARSRGVGELQSGLSYTCDIVKPRVTGLPELCVGPFSLTQPNPAHQKKMETPPNPTHN